MVGLEVTDIGTPSPYGPLLADGTRGGFNYGLITLGQIRRDTQISHIPHHIVIDRSYVHGQVSTHVKYGTGMNGSDLAVIDSYYAELHGVGQDTQAIVGYNGPGPFKIVNNYLEAAGENIIFGGADPTIPGLIPSDIEIRQNYLFKPLSWKIYPTPEQHWLVKNIFETKNNQRVLFEGNILENSWVDGQIGFAIVLKSANQDGVCTWCVSQDITLRNNIIKNSDNGVSLHTDDYPIPSAGQNRILFENNLFQNVGHRLVQITRGVRPQNDIRFVHNTLFENTIVRDYGAGIIFDTAPTVQGFVFNDNVVVPAKNLPASFIGSGIAWGVPTLNAHTPGWDVRGNIIVGVNDGANTVPNNSYSSLGNAGFVNPQAGDYTLTGSSAFKATATDGTDPGVNMDVVLATTRYTLTGGGSPPPAPPPVQPPAPPIVVNKPVVNFSASPSSILSGQSAVLIWTTQDATSCTTNSWSSSQATKGNVTVSPTQTTDYTLTCSNSAGTTSVVRTIVVTPTPTPVPPISLPIPGVPVPPIATPRFMTGDMIRTTSAVNVREYSTVQDGQFLGVQKVGAQGTIIGGPLTVNGFTRWNIDFTTGVDGWVVSNYIVEVSQTVPTPTPVPPISLPIPGVPVPPIATPRFMTGDMIRTTSAVNVREYSTVQDGQFLGVQKVGAQGTIIGGPLTVNGFTRWNIDFTTGVDGWVVSNYMTSQQ